MTVQLEPEKHGLVINKEFRSIDFNIITDNEALVIDNDLCKGPVTLQRMGPAYTSVRTFLLIR